MKGRRLRLSLGDQQVAAVQGALMFAIDTWRDPDEDLTPWDRALIERWRQADKAIVRAKRQQGWYDR